MITVEKRYNSQENYLRCWCASCFRELILLSYGVNPIPDEDMATLDHTATYHQQRHPKHNIFIYEGERLPTIQELRG